MRNKKPKFRVGDKVFINKSKCSPDGLYSKYFEKVGKIIRTVSHWSSVAYMVDFGNGHTRRIAEKSLIGRACDFDKRGMLDEIDKLDNEIYTLQKKKAGINERVRFMDEMKQTIFDSEKFRSWQVITKIKPKISAEEFERVIGQINETKKSL